MYSITIILSFIMDKQSPNVVFLIDATGSMGSTLEALKSGVFPQLFPVVPLYAPGSRFLLCIYRDFDQTGEDILLCRGPFVAADSKAMIQIIGRTPPAGGGDCSEAQKYALNMLMKEESLYGQTIIFHFTDAPPHSFPFPEKGNIGDNHFKEGQELDNKGLEKDWIPLCKQLVEHNMSMYTIGAIGLDSQKYYCCAADITGGDVILLKNTSAENILKTTIAVMTRALGYDKCDLTGLASLVRLDGEVPATENCPAFQNLKVTSLEFSKEHIPEIRTMSDVCDREKIENKYTSDKSFQMLCFDLFMFLIQEGQILALSYNPLLGFLYKLMTQESGDIQVEAFRKGLNKLIDETMNNLKVSKPQIHSVMSKWINDNQNQPVNL